MGFFAFVCAIEESAAGPSSPPLSAASPETCDAWTAEPAQHLIILRSAPPLLDLALLLCFGFGMIPSLLCSLFFSFCVLNRRLHPACLPACPPLASIVAVLCTEPQCRRCLKWLTKNEHWSAFELESAPFLALVLKKIPGLQKQDLVDAKWIWTGGFNLSSPVPFLCVVLSNLCGRVPTSRQTTMGRMEGIARGPS